MLNPVNIPRPKLAKNSSRGRLTKPGGRGEVPVVDPCEVKVAQGQLSCSDPLHGVFLLIRIQIFVARWMPFSHNAGKPIKHVLLL